MAKKAKIDAYVIVELDLPRDMDGKTYDTFVKWAAKRFSIDIVTVRSTPRLKWVSLYVDKSVDPHRVRKEARAKLRRLLR